MAAVATWIVARGSEDIYWRCQLPADALGGKLIAVPERRRKNFTNPNSSNKRGAFRWQPTETGAVYPDIEGTVVWVRPDIVRATHGAAMSANGHRVICEVDDNYLSNPSHNIFMRTNEFGPAARTGHMRAFATMDGIVCSTRWLRDEYARTFKKELGHVPEMHVARNHVDERDARWLDQKRPWRKLRVGIQGSYQHVHDWRLAAPALHLAAEMGCEVVFMGLDPAEHDPGWRDFLGEYTHLPWTRAELYHRQHIPFDIGLAPLVTTAHTLGKSDVKGLEYLMSGVAPVLQNNQVYNREWIHNETAMLAGSPDEMASQVAYLIKHPRFRRELVERGRQYVKEERTIQGNLHEWADPIGISASTRSDTSGSTASRPTSQCSRE